MFLHHSELEQLPAAAWQPSRLDVAACWAHCWSCWGEACKPCGRRGQTAKL